MPTRSRYSRALTLAGALLAAVTSVTVIAAPAQAANDASIAGNVRTQAGTPLANVDVILYKWYEDGDFSWWGWENQRFTNANGSYYFGRLSAGTYRVCANTYGNDPSYHQRCWKTGADVETGTDIPVAESQKVKSKVIKLVRGGTISGVVNLPGGAQGTVAVDVLNALGSIVRTIHATAGTTYTVGPLAAGNYRVQFDRASGHSLYSGQFYNGVPEVSGIGSATSVSVTKGADSPGVNATMALGGSITGYTKNTAGAGVRWCEVLAVADDGLRTTRLGTSNKQGFFKISGLSPGNYLVVVMGCINTEKWFDADRPRKLSTVKTEADAVAVSAGGVTKLGNLKVKNG